MIQEQWEQYQQQWDYDVTPEQFLLEEYLKLENAEPAYSFYGAIASALCFCSKKYRTVIPENTMVFALAFLRSAGLVKDGSTKSVFLYELTDEGKDVLTWIERLHYATDSNAMSDMQ